MMLIKTPRHWFPNSIDFALTTAAWIGFLYLLGRGVRGLLVDQDNVLLSNADIYIVSHFDLFIEGGLAIAILLVGWSKYQQVRSSRYASDINKTIADQQALSSVFKVPHTVLGDLQSNQVSVLYNDDQGNLSNIESLRLSHEHTATRRNAPSP